ncbi:MAG: PEP/pyruvate-binding domain-containing protein [Verrucomicrobiales bacterium]|nr:PEP/pyruvate-binding domain-containing protein [Verrucomicrobiales bacterium]
MNAQTTPRSKRAAFPIAIALLLGSACLTMADPDHAITSISRSEGGLLQLEVPLPTTKYAVLYRADGLTGTGRAIAVARSEQGRAILTDPAPIPANGFLKVHVHNTSSPADTDGDGINDLIELASPSSRNPLNPAPPIPAIDGTIQVPDSDTYQSLAHRDNFPGAANVQEVKFLIYDVHTGSPDLYFVNSNRYQYHYYFTRDAVRRYSSGSLFNSHTYFTNTGRRNVAGSIVYHPNYVSADGRPGLYTMEFWPADPVAFRFVETSFEMISSSMPFTDGRLAYHPASETQRGIYDSEKSQYEPSHISVIDTDELFGNTVYTALNPGECYGTLKLVTGNETVSTRDIVIFQTIPNELTHVAGIITESPQTPLSHVNLKARQNNTPNAYLEAASTHPDLAPFIGQDIYLEIGPDGFEVRSASQEEIDAYFDSIRPAETQFPVRDLSETDITPLSSIRFADAPGFGSKASNLGQLRVILPALTPQSGFAVPFYFYDAFMTHNGFYAEAEAMYSDPLFQAFPSVRNRRLKDFRNRIKDDGILPGWMLDALAAMQDSFPAGMPIRARSSTNNEDLEGFNGAGLYESYTHHPDEGHFAKTAKQVWAGLWTYRAFEEREFWRIDHLTAAMGILVHPNYDGELSNGVGVTKNIYIPGPGWDGHYVNAQVGENLITNPEPGSIPENYIIANLSFGSDYEIQYIRRSNLVPEGETVLSRDQALELKDYMDVIHSHFKGLYRGNSAFAMEIEFKVTAQGVFAIKQARPWVD